MKTKKRKVIVFLSVFFGVLLLAFLGCVLYISDYYKATEDVSEALNKEYDEFEIKYEEDSIEFIPKQEATEGFIFYPGGKVEYTAYAPLMISLAEEGVLCIIPQMTFNLAVFEMNAADGIEDRFDYVDSWYIGGHSLGGAMASEYLDKHISDFEGIVLLGAYANKDISNSNIKALLMYGSNDGVLNRDKYESKKVNLPSSYTEIVIEGGNHAYYGNYGEQKKDGVATISRSKQQQEVKEAILKLLMQ